MSEQEKPVDTDKRSDDASERKEEPYFYTWLRENPRQLKARIYSECTLPKKEGASP